MINPYSSFRIIILVFLAAFVFIVQQAVSNASGAPTGGTGAPGESNCSSCHTGTPTNNSSAIRVITNMSNGQYIPDSTYEIIIRAKKTGGVKFGFSATMLNSNASPTKLGLLQIPSGATSVQLATGTRDYTTHTTAGNAAIYTDSTDWVINWKAPSTISGDAKLYIAVVASNNDGLVTGDEVHLKDYTYSQTSNIPVASITTNVNTSCTNDSVYFQGSGTNGTTAYNWIFPGGDPAASTDQNVWVKFNAGTKVCSLRVANAIMYSQYVTKLVTINNAPLNANISYNNSTLLCEGDSIVLTATFNASYSYQWQRNDTTISGATNVQYYAKATGNYRAIITNAVGCSAYTSSVNLNFNPSPNPVLQSFNSITSTCQGDSILLLTDGGNNYSYYWYRDNVLEFQSLDTFRYAYLSGIYTVKAFTTIGCNRESNPLNITFFNKPAGSIASQADSICDGDVVKVNAFTNDTIASYQWYKDSVPIMGANNQEYDVTTTGSYMVDLISNRGCAATFAAKFIKVNPLPPSNFIDTSRIGCAYTIQIRNPGNYSYEWLRDGILFTSNIASVTVTQSGVYSVIITNAFGCKVTTNSLAINLPLPPPNFIDSVRVGCGYQLKLRNPGNFSFQWQHNNATFNTTDSIISVTQSGVYSMIITNSSGCNVYTNSLSLTIPTVLPDTVMTPVSNATICSDSSGVLYQVPAKAGISYQWYKNGMMVPGATLNFLNIKDSGVYFVSVSNGFCSVNAAFRKVTVNPTPIAVIAGNTQFCAGDSTALSTGIVSGASYQWFHNNNIINGATDTMFRVKASGTYFVKVTLGNCSKNSNVQVVIENGLPPKPVITRNSNLLTTGIYASYQWFKDGNAIPGETAQSYSVTADGNYSVQVASSNGCQNISALLNVIFTGIESPANKAIEFEINPNPVLHYLNIQCSEVDQYFIQLSDASGRFIQRYNLKEDKIKIDFSALASGIYFLRITNSETSQTMKIVKR